MVKSIFSKSVIKSINNDFLTDIRQSVIGDSRLKKEMNRIFQIANRRAQNIEKNNLVSPALRALEAERDIEGYTKFSIAGFDIKNEFDWIRAKEEYGRALAFINNPTSTATGARQYIKNVAEKYTKGDTVKASIILEKVTEPEINASGRLNIFNYGALLQSFSSDVMEVERDMYEDSLSYQNALENRLNENLGKMFEDMSKDKNIFTELFGDSSEIMR